METIKTETVNGSVITLLREEIGNSFIVKVEKDGNVKTFSAGFGVKSANIAFDAQKNRAAK